MKSLAILLLLANGALAAWLVLSGPLGQTHEPTRLALQVAADRFHLVTEAELEKQRQAQATEPPKTVQMDLPRADCIILGGFPSAAAAHRALTRLNGQIAGLHAASNKEDAVELRFDDVNDKTEAAIQKALTEYPKVSLAHCLASVSVPATP